MDDISQKLAELLNDEETLNKVRAMAENLLGNDGEKPAATKPVSSESVFGDTDLDPAQIVKVMSVMSKLKSSNTDSRANLLLALKPLLSVPRREKVDTAIKLLRLIDMLPLIKDSGILNF